MQSLAALRAALDARFGKRLRDLRLFGSYARGEAYEESDVDVLVLIDDVTRSESEEVVAMAHDVGDVGDRWLVISALVRDPIAFDALHRGERRIAQDIDREGITF
jgi:predicted nucleotidyltransferase